MNSREYQQFFRFLMETECPAHQEIIFVESVAKWCKEHGVEERDTQRPFKAVLTDGRCWMVIRSEIPEETIHERINAARMRDQIMSVASEQVDMLDSTKKQIAFLFLREYASSLPDIDHDRIADAWAFDEMKRLGLFSE